MGSLDVGSLVADTYEVTRLIGRGGMGEVWLAKHRRLPGKQVAIKVLHLGGKPLSADALTRFRREAEVATRIDHPNIVEVHDFNTLPDGTPYVVLEFLQGESLASRLRHPIGVEEVQAILRQVGSALQAAHANGVVHRDLKPDNIFLVAGPIGSVVKVLDFGISKLVDSTTLQTQDAVLVGTPAYMSPEQALGQNKEVGPQSDVFALGAIAYEMLAGTPPFGAESVAQLVFRIAYEAHPPLATVKQGLPASVVEAVERALKKDRAQRSPDVAAFILGLTGSPLPAPRRPDQAGEPSGVATPGIDTNDSLMMGKTVAPTPAPPRAVATPAAPPRPAPVSVSAQIAWGRRLSLVAGVAGVLVAGALFSRIPDGHAGRMGELEPASEPEGKELPAAKPPAPAPAAPAPPAPLPPPPAEARASDRGPAPGAAKKFPMPPPEERAQLEELLTLVKAGDFKQAVAVADRANRLALSSTGLSFAAMLATQVHCGRKDQGAAQTRFRMILLPAHREAAKSFCAKYIDTTVLNP